MANFDEDIRRITNEVLQDGTVDQIIREKVTDGIKGAISDSFGYGKLRNAIKERVEQVLVPFIEKYDMSDYIVKMDTVLTEIVNQTALVDNKRLLRNFQYLMTEPQEEEVKLSDLFREYEKYVAKHMETDGREISYDDGFPEYEPMEVYFEAKQVPDRDWSSFIYAQITFGVEEEDQQEELNRTINISRYKKERKEGFKLRIDTDPDLDSLRGMSDFDLLLLRMQRADVRLIIDEQHNESCVYSENKPEATFE